MERQGALLAEGVNAAARDAGIEQHVRAIGRPSCLVFETADAEGEPSQAYRTLFLQELLLGGVLGQSFVISAAHTDADVEQTLDAVRAALPVYRKALEAGQHRRTAARQARRARAPPLRRAPPHRLIASNRT